MQSKMENINGKFFHVITTLPHERHFINFNLKIGKPSPLNMESALILGSKISRNILKKEVDENELD